MLELLVLALLVIVEDVVGFTEVEDSTEVLEVLTVIELLEEGVTLTVEDDVESKGDVVGLTVLVMLESAGMEIGMVGMLIVIVAGIVGSVNGRVVDRLLLDEVLTELELAEVEDVIFVVVVFAAAGKESVLATFSR